MKAEQLLEVPSNTINFLKAAGSIVILCLHYEYLLIYSDQYIPRAEGISQSLQYVFQYGETAVEMFFPIFSWCKQGYFLSVVCSMYLFGF